MSSKTTILKLLQKKLELFTQYEKETDNLLSAPIDTMEDYITNRAAIANDIDAISCEIHNIFAANEDKILQDTVLCKCNDSKVKAEHREIYEVSKQIYAIISRVQETEKQITESMKLTRAKLKERINDTKNTPKIARYLENLTAGREDGFLSDLEKKV
ncbi:MAG: hypothetical protein RR576_04815 [Oscillospiraceae bacterium]